MSKAILFAILFAVLVSSVYCGFTEDMDIDFADDDMFERGFGTTGQFQGSRLAFYRFVNGYSATLIFQLQGQDASRNKTVATNRFSTTTGLAIRKFGSVKNIIATFQNGTLFGNISAANFVANRFFTCVVTPRGAFSCPANLNISLDEVMTQAGQVFNFFNEDPGYVYDAYINAENCPVVAGLAQGTGQTFPYLPAGRQLITFYETNTSSAIKPNLNLTLSNNTYTSFLIFGAGRSFSYRLDNLGADKTNRTTCAANPNSQTTFPSAGATTASGGTTTQTSATQTLGSGSGTVSSGSGTQTSATQSTNTQTSATQSSTTTQTSATQSSTTQSSTTQSSATQSSTTQSSTTQSSTTQSSNSQSGTQSSNAGGSTTRTTSSNSGNSNNSSAMTAMVSIVVALAALVLVF